MKDFKPYADDTASITVGGVTVENGTDRIALYGNVDITRDAAGLEAARKLKGLLDAVVAAIEAAPAKEAAPKEATVPVSNPFG